MIPALLLHYVGTVSTAASQLDAIPIIWEGVGVQTKMMLLTMAPGDSQQELGTMFGLSSRSHRRQKDKLLARRQIIPTKTFEKEMLQALPVERVQEGIFRHLRMAHMEFRPPSIVQLVAVSPLTAAHQQGRHAGEGPCWPHQ